ncbi:WD40-repeat-containing domain protein [Sporodiniella umbellata]|nr:WD40-repeat-containing domain protein [Sporodiniella umbellata]
MISGNEELKLKNAHSTLETISGEDEDATHRKQKKSFFERIGLKKKQIAPTTGKYVNEYTDDEDGDSIVSSDDDQPVVVPHMSSSTPNLKQHTFIKTKTKYRKQNQDFSRIMLAQSIQTCEQPADELGHNHPYGAIWTQRFSKDGCYLASAGQSCVVFVWKLANSLETPVQVLEKTPHREYEGHTADVLDLAWSKNDFLLSSSMDNTVRLWHVSQQECLCVFQHLNFVTSVKFHPKDDRFFLSSSMDGRVRLWNMPEKKVAFWNEIPGSRHVTAVGFTLDGKTVIAGSEDGNCYFFETQGLKYNTQLSVMAKKSKKKGPKVTGIELMPGMPPGEEKILITTNDSRVRLFNMKDKSLMFKYKGHLNPSLQIKATFSDDGRYIICGSEDLHAYIWRTEQTNVSSHAIDDPHFSDMSLQVPSHSQSNGISKWLKRRDDESNNHHNNTKSQTEYFEAHDHFVTSTVFAPLKTRQHTTRPCSQRRLSVSSDLATNDSEGYVLVTADNRGTIKVWKTDSGSADATQQPRPLPSSPNTRRLFNHKQPK